MDRSMGHVITHLAQGTDVRTNWAVDSVEYGSGPSGDVTVRAVDGRVVRCRAALVTASIKVLQVGG